MPSKALETYLSNYGNFSDPILKPLKKINEMFVIKKVLYPGSWIHLTPSLVFPIVVYVDFFSKMESMFNDPELLHYITTNSEVRKKPIIMYHRLDYRNSIPEEKESFDLLISLSGGFVSKYCGYYLKKNGILFVNNEHYDAVQAFFDKNYLLIGVFLSNGILIQQKNQIQEYFKTKKNEFITSEMVIENSKRSPSRAKYKLKKRAPFYLFTKI